MIRDVVRRLCWSVAFVLAGSACATHRLDGIALRAQMEFLAGDAMNGRGSGTRDEQIAAEYVGNYFRSLGLESADSSGRFVQAVDIERRTLAGPPQLIAGEQRWTHGNEILATVLPPNGWSGTLLHLAAATDLARVSQGSVVVLPATLDAAAAAELFRAGARAILTPETPQIRTQWTIAGQRSPSLPARLAILAETAPDRAARIILSTAAADAVRQMPDGTPIRLETQQGAIERSRTWNAVGIVRGSEPRRSGDAILISAHLDGLGRREADGQTDPVYNGADDDASGTVAVMAIAKALSVDRPRRTVIFAAFGSEEMGNLGSVYFIERPPVPLRSMVANIQFEMIGRPDSAVQRDTLWLTGYGRSNLGAALAAHGARLVADPHPSENFFRRSDNYPLALRGIVAHTISSFGLHRDYHEPSDDLSHIDWTHMESSIASLLRPLKWLASSDFVPEWNSNGRP